MKYLSKKILLWLRRKGVYVLKKIDGTSTMFKDGLGNKYSIIKK